MQITPEMVRKILAVWERLTPKERERVASALRRKSPLTLWVLIYRIPELRRLYRLAVGREPEFKIPEIEEAIERAMDAVTLNRVVEIDIKRIGIENLEELFPEGVYPTRVVLTRDEREAIKRRARKLLREWFEDVVGKKYGESVERVVEQIRRELYKEDGVALDIVKDMAHRRAIERIGGYRSIRRVLAILIERLREAGVESPAEYREHISAMLDRVGECKSVRDLERALDQYLRRVVRPIRMWPPPGRPIRFYVPIEEYEKAIRKRLEELGEAQKEYRPDMTQEEIEKVYFEREFPRTPRIEPPPPDAPLERQINYLAQKLGVLRHFKSVLIARDKPVPQWVEDSISELEERIRYLSEKWEKEWRKKWGI